MLDHGFIDNDVIQPKLYKTWWAEKRVCDLPLSTPLTITSDVTCKDAIALLKGEGFDMVPVIKENSVIGVVTEGNMTSALLNGRAEPDTTVANAGVIYKTFRKIGLNHSLAYLAQALDLEPYALIITEQRCFSGGGAAQKRRKMSEDDEDSVTTSSTNGGGSSSSLVVTRSVVSGIVTRIDLLDYVSTGGGEGVEAGNDKAKK
jgi:cystathionine beta-synthase